MNVIRKEIDMGTRASAAMAVALSGIGLGFFLALWLLHRM